MIYILFFINTLSIAFGNLYLNKFYSFMDNDNVLKFEITITQSQFNSDYISEGDFYFVENNHYVYDTKLKRLTFNNDEIITLNKSFIFSSSLIKSLSIKWYRASVE